MVILEITDITKRQYHKETISPRDNITKRQYYEEMYHKGMHYLTRKLISITQVGKMQFNVLGTSVKIDFFEKLRNASFTRHTGHALFSGLRECAPGKLDRLQNILAMDFAFGTHLIEVRT